MGMILLMCSQVAATGSVPLKRKAPVVFWVDFDCLTKNYPQSRLKRVVRDAIRHFGGLGAATWGDRAIAYDVNGDGTPEYFIPLLCGATGDCSWGVFRSNSPRLLGVLGAENIYVRKRVAQWAALTVYIHQTASDGIVRNYSFHNGRYIKHGGDRYVSAYFGEPGYENSGLHPYPSFMKTVRSPCSQRQGY